MLESKRVMRRIILGNLLMFMRRIHFPSLGEIWGNCFFNFWTRKGFDPANSFPPFNKRLLPVAEYPLLTYMSLYLVEYKSI